MKVEILRPHLGAGSPIPLFSASVKGGFPSPADDFVEKTLDLNELLISHPAATYFVRVSGNSMEDAHIFDGDILVVDRAVVPKQGQIVVAALAGEFTVKKLQAIEGKTFLYTENPSYPPIRVDDRDDFEVFGTVTYVIHNVRSH